MAIASSYNPIRCVWIMVISRGWTILCRHDVLGTISPACKGVWQYKCRMASANILLAIINHLLYRFIARQASAVLVKVLILSCVSWPVCLSYKRHDGSMY